jgi:hypothetical protein
MSENSELWSFGSRNVLRGLWNFLQSVRSSVRIRISSNLHLSLACEDRCELKELMLVLACPSANCDIRERVACLERRS